MVSFVVSPEKEQLLKAVVAKFNASGEQVAGRRVFVSMKAMNSGDAENAIARGRLQPDVWSPAGSFWGRLLNLRADQPFVANDNPSIVRTPLVIAMWEPMAQALGDPRKPVAFEDIVELATDPRGWASVGKPNFGRFKYVHTNPDSSTSGAEAVTGSYYSLVGKKEGLTNADVARAAPRVKDLERSVVHYGDSTLFIEDQLCKGGLAYASAVAMEETTVIDFNRRRCSSTKLVSLYPQEGSFFSDSPYIVLNAGWVKPADRQAAVAFRKFLASEVDADLAGRYGFRPGDPEGKPAGLVSAANGADPAQPRRELSLPEPPVLHRVLTTWRRDRKPARVMLVLDNSGSMQDEDKLVHAKQGLLAFFRQVAPQDEIGLTKFSGQVSELVAPAPFARNRDALTRAVNGIIPEDDTAVYDATMEAVEAIKSRRRRAHQRGRGPHRRRRHDVPGQQPAGARSAHPGGQGREQRGARVHHRLRVRRQGVRAAALRALTFFDADEAERVGDELRGGRRGEHAPGPRRRHPRAAHRRARAAGARDGHRHREAIAQADHPFDDVATDVDALVAAMDTSARRAQLISTTLAGQARAGQDVAGLERAIAELRGRADDADVRALRADLEAQRDATARLEDRLERFEVGMRRICASLGLLRTRLVEMSASEEEAAQRELARQSRELRERTDLLAEAMAEVFAADEDQQVELPVAEHRPDG